MSSLYTCPIWLSIIIRHAMVEGVNFIFRLAIRVLLNVVALWIATKLFGGFEVVGAEQGLFIAGLVLALLNTFLKPVLKLISTPLIWITLGFFNIVIYMIILYIATLIPFSGITISDGFSTLFFVSIIIGLVNAVY